MPQLTISHAKSVFVLPLLLACIMLAGFTAQATSAAFIDDDDPPKKALTIKDIMKKAHKDGLVKKVATGKATAEEKKSLHDYYTKLAKLTQPKGDKKSWDTKTKALVDAAKLAVDDDPTYKAKLKAASKCADCHKLHKP